MVETAGLHGGQSWRLRTRERWPGSRAGQEYFVLKYICTSLSTICKVLGMYSNTFLGNLQYLYLYLSTFQMYFDFQVLLDYI